MQSAHTLIAPDEHSKRQWLTTLQKAIDTRRAGKAATTARPALPLEVAVAPITKQGSRTALFQVGKAASTFLVYQRKYNYIVGQILLGHATCNL